MGISDSFFQRINKTQTNNSPASGGGVSSEFFQRLGGVPLKEEEEEDREPSFFEKLRNTAKGLFDLSQASGQLDPDSRMLWQAEFGIMPEQVTGAKALNPDAVKTIQEQKGPDYKQLGKDALVMGGVILDAMGATDPSGVKTDKRIRNEAKILSGNVGGMVQGFKQQANSEGLLSAAGGLAGGLAAGLYDIGVHAPLEALTGAKLGEANLRALTPEEHNKAIKTTAGVVAGILIGNQARQLAGTHSMKNARKIIGGNVDDITAGAPVSNLLTKQTTLTNIDDLANSMTMEQAQRLKLGEGNNKFGAVGRKIRAGLYEGSVGGGAQSLIENYGEEGAAAKVVTDALLFAPLGALVELAIPGQAPGAMGAQKQWTPEGLKQLGYQVAAEKQLKLSLDALLRDDAVAEIMRRPDYILKSDDLVDALIKHRIDELRTGKPVIINGVSLKKAQEIEDQLNANLDGAAKARLAAGKAKEAELKVGTVSLNDRVNFDYNDPGVLRATVTKALGWEGIDLTEPAYYTTPVTKNEIVDQALKDINAEIMFLNLNHSLGKLDPLPLNWNTFRSIITARDINGYKISNYSGRNETLFRQRLDIDFYGSPDHIQAVESAAKAAEKEFLANNPAINLVKSNVNDRAILYDLDGPHSNKNIDFFKDNGFLPDEIVEYNGQEFIVDYDATTFMRIPTNGSNAAIQGDELILLHPKTGAKLTVNANELGVKQGQQGLHFIPSERTLRGEFFQEYNALVRSGNNPVRLENSTRMATRALDYYKKYILPALDEADRRLQDWATVENVAPIAFRGGREGGKVIPGTGTFYSIKADVAGGYARMGTEKVPHPNDPTKKIERPVRQLKPHNFTVLRLPFKKLFVMRKGAFHFGKNLARGEMMDLKGITPEEIAAFQGAENVLGKDPEVKKLGKVYSRIRKHQEKFDVELKKTQTIYASGFDENYHLQMAYGATLITRPDDLFDRMGMPDSRIPEKTVWDTLNLDQKILYVKEELENIELRGHVDNTRGKTHPESGYQLKDKIVAKILRRNGYDGYLKSVDGGANGMELVDLTESRQPTADTFTDPTGKQTVKFTMDNQRGGTEGIIYDNRQEQELTRVFTEELESSKWLTKDDPEPFQQLVTQFGEKYGILPEDMPNFVNHIERTLREKIIDATLPPDEKEAWARAHLSALHDVAKHKKARDAGLMTSARKLKKMAAMAGFYLDRSDNGAFIIREAKTHRTVVTTFDAIGAEQFLRASGGNFDAIDLLQGNIRRGTGGQGIVPPTGIASGLIDPPHGWDDDNFSEPFAYKPGVFSSFRDMVNTTSFGKLFAETPRRLRSFDAMLGTSLFAGVFDPVQTARSAEIAQKIGWLDRLQGVDRMATGLTADQREQIFSYIETMSPDELIKRGLQSREMTPVEVQIAKEFHDLGINDKMVMALRGDMRKHLKALQEGAIDEPTFMAGLRESGARLGADQRDLDGFMVIHNILRSGVGQSDFSLGAVMRLFRAYGDPNAVPRDVFASRFKLTPQQLKVADELDKYFSEIVGLSNVKNKQLLNGYMAHARKYYDNNINGAIADFTRIDPAARKFFASMSRTGELSAIEMDPIKAALRYTNALFRTQNTEVAITKALWKARAELRKIENKEIRNSLKKEISDYIEGIRGYPDAVDKVAQSMFGMWWEKAFSHAAPELRRELVNTSLNIFELGIQGFRAKAGLLDVFSNMALTYAEKGSARTLKTMKYGLAAFKDGRLEKLRTSGAVPPELMALFFSDPEGEAMKGLTGKVKGAEASISKMADVGLKFSGQKHVYAIMQVGAYIENWEYAAGKLMDMQLGKITKQEAYTDLNLQRYGKAAITEFERLVQGGETEKAANFYAKVARDASQKVYGLARNPAWMQRNMGRMIGQFSAWPIWARSAILDGISTGTAKQRIAYLARYGVAVSALAAIGAEYEMDFSNWMPHRGLLPGGGPALQMVRDIATATTSSYGPEQVAAQQRLMKLVPHINEDGEYNVGPIFPGGIAINDLIEAQQVANEGYDSPAVFARMLGVQTNTQDKSIKDQTIAQSMFGWDWWEDD